MQGKLIVIEGTDGSGKDTHTRMLLARLQKEDVPMKSVSFPTYGTASCKGVERYLNGELGSPEYVGPHYASMLFAFNRWKEMQTAKEELANGTNYIVNRYTGSSAGHQAGKIANEEERRAFLEWLFHLEFGIFGLPEPHLTILLHMPAAVGQQFVDRKEGREHLQGKTRDIHEEDLAHLEAAESTYQYVAANTEGWTTIECAKAGCDREMLLDPAIEPEEKVRPLSEINDELYGLVTDLL